MATLVRSDSRYALINQPDRGGQRPIRPGRSPRPRRSSATWVGSTP